MQLCRETTRHRSYGLAPRSELAPDGKHGRTRCAVHVVMLARAFDEAHRACHPHVCSCPAQHDPPSDREHPEGRSPCMFPVPAEVRS